MRIKLGSFRKRERDRERGKFVGRLSGLLAGYIYGRIVPTAAAVLQLLLLLSLVWLL